MVTTVAKMARLGPILEAAKVLHDAGLIKELPAAVVKRYVGMHPDINILLSRMG